MKYDLHTRNTEVRVYGSLSAVSTSYVTDPNPKNCTKRMLRISQREVL